MSEHSFLAARSFSQALGQVRELGSPNRIFLVTAGANGRTSEEPYRKLFDTVSRTRGLFASYGLKEGERILVATQDDASLISLVIACFEHGLSAVVADPDSTAYEANHLADISKPSRVFVDSALRKRWQEAADGDRVVQIGATTGGQGKLFSKLMRKTKNEPIATSYPALLTGIDPVEDVADVSDEAEGLVLFTSGTTSKPRGVRLSRKSLFKHAQTLTRVFGYDRGSRLLDVLPLHHTDGFFHGCLVAWLNTAVALRPVRFTVGSAHELLDSVYRYRATHFISVPTILALLERFGEGYEDALQTDDLRVVVSAAGLLDEDLWRRFERRFGVRVCNYYGLTETVTAGVFCGPSDESYRIGTIGKPIDCGVRIVDEDGEEVSDGRSGELWISGESVTMGYLTVDSVAAQSIENGWLRTGDIVERDSDGFLSVAGRKKNIVVSGGLNIHPEEVTEVILGLQGVVDAATVGLHDDTHGEVLGACVVTEVDSSLSTEQIVAHCRQRLAPYKIPREVAIVPDLPRGPVGKVILPQVRELLKRGAVGSDSCAGADIEEHVIAVAARVFNLPAEKLNGESSLDSTPGWDSFGHLSLAVALESAFDLRLSTADILAIRSLADAQRTIRGYIRS